jgi:chemotaxis protein CheD
MLWRFRCCAARSKSWRVCVNARKPSWRATSRGCCDQDDPVSLSARYGAFAMEVLINSLISLGAQRALLEAKVFGGGNVLPGMTTMNIGQRNAEFALRFLDAEKIRVVARDLIDVYPRKVYYFPRSGKVLVKKLRNVHNDTIYQREIEYARHLVKEEIAGDVELFG